MPSMGLIPKCKPMAWPSTRARRCRCANRCRNQRPEGREIPQHVLFSVRPPQHRRPRAHRVRDRAAVDPSGNHCGRRTALGWAGALHPLPGFPEKRLLRSQILVPTTVARKLYRETLDHLFAEYRHFSEEMFGYLRERTPKPDEMKQEAYERTLQAPGIRSLAIPVAIGDQHFPGPDCQRTDAGEPGFAALIAHPR